MTKGTLTRRQREVYEFITDPLEVLLRQIRRLPLDQLDELKARMP